MKKVKISIIAAMSENRVIGFKNKIPWHIREDLIRFKEKTLGRAIIMGRKTLESIGKPLPNRINIIVTRDKNFSIPVHSTSIKHLIKVTVCYSLEEAIKKSKVKSQKSKVSDEIFIIGGGQIYHQAMKYADKLYLTIVKGNFEGDTFFPDYSEFKEVVYKRESRDKNYRYTFLELERQK